MNSAYAYDPMRRALIVAYPRLTKLLQRNPESCASLSEYSAATGIPTGEVVTLLGGAVDEGVLGFEICADEVFVHTAPRGRPTPAHLPEVAPNLWERLRGSGSVDEAYSLWRLVRGMERGGWRVETNAHRITFGLAAMRSGPVLGLQIGTSMVPVLIHPTTEQIAHPGGLLTAYQNAGARAVAVLVDSGGLDDAVTAARRWGLSLAGASMSLVVLEAPSYSPTLVRTGDASVAPRSVSQQALAAGGVDGI